MNGLAVVALIMLAAAPALADPVRVERTAPDHLRALMQPPVVPKEILPPRTRFTRSQAVYSLPKGLDGLAKFDPALSHLCQRGAFLQESDGFYWARTPDKRYGVAFSGGANLVDPQGKRQKGQVYFFDGQDSRCRVYVGEQARLMPNYIGQGGRP
ncbi:hypothetical protein [Azospirillum canadense]|uniref:hypothetical protein n=1 Tax=Azospirillum canadense TaxID=403962 RepID=UPI00222729B5|nr:hypothetical protein [Azospirillum canadense]MCW2243383.1 hypothetical protein [Azospirillum canadense]